jgi:CPA2 family monovalent cation:H+ antiporter-2
VEIPFLAELVLVFGLAVGVLLLCHRLKVPPVIGFLLTGVVAGPHGLALISAVHEVELLAEIGVVLLLFTIGLELSPGEVLRLGRSALFGGTAQALLTTLLVGGVALALGASVGQAVFAGFLVTVSSTAIVLRLLQASAQTESPHGRMALAILLFQDLAVVPMILLAPLLAGTESEASPLHMLAGLLAVALIFVVGRKVVPWILHAVAGTRSRETFLLATLVLCLAVALATSRAGLSLALGAFLAGLIVAGSPYSLSALQGVLPFRDVFTSLFFVSVGMLLDTRILLEQPVLVFGGTLLLLSGKAVVITGIVLALGHPLRMALLVGLSLGQVGEFAFILARSGLDLGLLRGHQYQLFLATSILTMVATPLCIAAAPHIAEALARLPLPRRLLEDAGGEAPEETLRDHLIIVGYGLGGRHLVRASRGAAIPYRILEMNPVTVREEAARGEPISLGDASLPAVLEHVGIAEARVMAVVVSDPVAIRRIVEVARRMSPSLHLVVRTRFASEIAPLRALGADHVIAEEFETSVEVFTRVLTHFLVPHDVIETFTHDVRDEGYAMLRLPAPITTSARALEARLPDQDVVGLRVHASSALEGRSLGEANLRRVHGLTVLAVARAGAWHANPDATWRFEAEDVAWLFGTRDRVRAAGGLFSAPRGA